MCTVLTDAAAVFVMSLILHVIVWRIREPLSYSQWLPRLVVVFLGIGPAIGWLIVRRGLFTVEASPLDPLTAWVAVLLLHGSVSTVYIIGYTLVSGFSPSIEILKLLERAPRGLSREEMHLPYLTTAVGGDRVSNLLDGGLILARGDEVGLGPRARMLTRLVLAYRHFIGLPDGAGG